MKRTLLIAAAVVLAAIMAFGIWRSRERADMAPSLTGETAETSDAPHDETELEVPEEMLRDLRITTTKVESRDDAERSTILGELRINENAYAEVASPVAGRVSRLHANTGETVAESGARGGTESGPGSRTIRV